MMVRMKLPTATLLRRIAAIGICSLCAIGAALFAADKVTDISINQPKDLFPESITSLKDGTIIWGATAMIISELEVILEERK